MAAAGGNPIRGEARTPRYIGVGERRMGNKNFPTRTKTYHGDVRARLLTLVQVGDCWNYALEAIINIVIIIIPVSR